MVFINGLAWTLKLNNDLREDLFGETNYETLTIYIRPQCDEQTQVRSLKHEVIHAFLYSYGLVFKKEFTQEEMCEFIAHNIETINNVMAGFIADWDLLRYNGTIL